MNRITRAIATFTLVSVLAVAPAATAAPSLAPSSRKSTKNRPLLFNIARGSYKKHTVTATGYRTYTYKAKTLGVPVSYSRPFVAVADSWRTSTRWIDFNSLAYDVFTAGFGSFNTMELKK